MGFFKSIAKGFSSVVHTVAQTVTNPAKATTAILTGGLSVVAPKPFAPVTKAIGNTLYNPSLALKVAGLATGGNIGGLLAGGSFPQVGGSTMGINLNSIFGGLASGIGSYMGGGSPMQSLQAFTSYLPTATQTPFPGSQAPNPYQVQTAASSRALVAAGAAVGRRFFDKFPNLATGIQMWRNQGKKITRAKLYSLMKRFGPDFLITGGILSAAAVSELMMAGPGTRRMNPANGKALRRSLRRLESFDKMCHRVSRHLHRPARRSSKSRGGAATFVRQG